MGLGHRPRSQIRLCAQAHGGPLPIKTPSLLTEQLLQRLGSTPTGRAFGPFLVASVKRAENFPRSSRFVANTVERFLNGSPANVSVSRWHNDLRDPNPLVKSMIEDIFGDVPQPNVDWYPNWLSPERAELDLARVIGEVAWKQDTMHTPGGPTLLPRLTAWQGDAGAVYVYSGIRNVPLAWTATVQTLKEAAEAVCGARFNSVLLNRYRSGGDSMGWHADREPELGVEPVIASVSLGAARRFDMRHNKTGVVQSFQLTGGSLLVMRGRTQAEWRHRVPKETNVRGERVNLTFRWVTPRS
jgi:alkylated DNA repair dioxygenase AlkB